MSRQTSPRTLLAVNTLEDRAVPAAHALYSVTQDWGTGFQAQIQLTNDGAAAVPFNTLQFALPSNITSVWDAKLVSHTGNLYSVTNAGWDATIPVGGNVTFGFTATRGGSTAATGFVLNGVSLDTPVVPPVAPPPVVPPVSPPPVTPASQVSFKVASDWGSGMTGDIIVKNTGTAALTGWKVSFDFPGAITSAWNGTIVSHVGKRYTVAAASYNASIPAGGSVDIGFGATPGGVAATNFALSSTSPPPVVPPVVPPPPAVNHAPVATNDTASTPAETAVAVSVLANDTDADGDKLNVLSTTPANHGSVTVNTNGTVTYTPAAGYSGADTFGYTVSDGKGGTATGSVSVQVQAPTVPPVVPPATPSSWPAQVFAPYVDATAWPTFDFVAAAKAAGVKYYTLGFVTAGPQNAPAWGGYASLGAVGSDFAAQLQGQIASLRAMGGDAAVSFGGASGQELAQTITNVSDLAAAYRSVVQTYGLTHIDFDIEGAAVADKASIDRRSQAIAVLQHEAVAAGKELNVRFTLPVLPTGLDGNGLYVLQSAKQAGVTVNEVNVMAMDYGDNAAPNPAGHMGDYAIQAATSLFGQLTSLYGTSLTDAQRWAMIGVTPMIGLNDVTTEKFTQSDAHQLEAWAASHHLGLLSMWSINRDKQASGGALSYVDTNSSSLVQTPYEFSGIFAPFVG